MQSYKSEFCQVRWGLPVLMSVPEGCLHGAAHPSAAERGEATARPLAAAGSAGLGTAHGGTSRCERSACWGFPLC